MIVSIYEVFAMFIELLMNRYVFAYVVLPGLVVAGIIKNKEILYLNRF